MGIRAATIQTTPYDTDDSMVTSEDEDPAEALNLITDQDKTVAMKKRKQSMRLVNLLQPENSKSLQAFGLNKASF